MYVSGGWNLVDLGRLDQLIKTLTNRLYRLYESVTYNSYSPGTTGYMTHASHSNGRSIKIVIGCIQCLVNLGLELPHYHTCHW